jgi:hypothetical protein
MQFVLAHKIAWHIGAPLRRKAFELKHMLNFEMWQGVVVDKIIETEIIPNIRKKYLDFEAVAEKAVQLAKKQFDFSQEQLYQFVPRSEAGSAYCILDIHEALRPYEESEVEQVYQTIRQCILNFPETVMPKGGTLLEFLRRPKGNLIPNINWMWLYFNNVSINPQIDLLFEWKDYSMVIDWKVSNSFLLDAGHQLEVCGLAVYNYNQKKGLESGKTISHENIHLLEVNLLKKEIKKHDFTLNIANQELDYINLSNQDFELTIQGKAWDKIRLEQIDRTDNMNACEMCRFRTLCCYLITHQFKYDEPSYSQYVRDTEFA